MPCQRLPAKLWTMRGLCLGIVLALSALSGAPLPAQQDSVRVRPPAMITGGDLARLGAFGVLTLGAYHVDDRARVALRGHGRHHGLNYALEQVGDIYSYGGAVGVGAGMWIGGMLSEDRVLATTGLRALEAIFAAGVVAKAIKGVAGRARPVISPDDPSDFEWGRGFGVIDGVHESFPSGHATIVFAFASAVTGEVRRSAPHQARKVALASYGLAALTAYSRITSDEHWLSDITLGAGIGMVSGWAVTRWHATRPDNWVDRFFLRPVMGTGPRGELRLGFAGLTR